MLYLYYNFKFLSMLYICYKLIYVTSLCVHVFYYLLCLSSKTKASIAIVKNIQQYHVIFETASNCFFKVSSHSTMPITFPDNPRKLPLQEVKELLGEESLHLFLQTLEDTESLSPIKQTIVIQ